MNAIRGSDFGNRFCGKLFFELEVMGGLVVLEVDKKSAGVYSEVFYYPIIRCRLFILWATTCHFNCIIELYLLKKSKCVVTKGEFDLY